MKKINNEMKINLLKIENMRITLGSYLKNGLINEKDIFDLAKFNTNYGCTKAEKENYKELILKQIYNCPFLLCDQENLSNNVRSILPMFLNARYNVELNELNYMLDEGQLSFDEYIDEKEKLKFYYYESSIDGKKIKNKGYSSNYSKKKIKTKN